MSTYHTIIHMHDTDAAGLLFFGRQFEIAHAAYEAVLKAHGLPFEDLLRHKPYFVVIAHAAADYKAQLYVGDEIDVDVTVDRLGKSSFTLVYELRKSDGTLAGTGKTVHVSIDQETRKKISLPDELRSLLQKIPASR